MIRAESWGVEAPPAAFIRRTAASSSSSGIGRRQLSSSSTAGKPSAYALVMTSELSEWVVLQAYRVGAVSVVDYLVSVKQGMEWWAGSVEQAQRFDSKAAALIVAQELPRTSSKVITGVTAVELLPGSVQELFRLAKMGRE